jgi:hypothetical protein
MELTNHDERETAGQSDCKKGTGLSGEPSLQSTHCPALPGHYFRRVRAAAVFEYPELPNELYERTR